MPLNKETNPILFKSSVPSLFTLNLCFLTWMQSFQVNYANYSGSKCHMTALSAGDVEYTDCSFAVG